MTEDISRWEGDGGSVMPRSQTIWLLAFKNYDDSYGPPGAAFTVKHEMMTYLDRNRWQWGRLRLFKMKDSPHPSVQHQSIYDVQELDIREVMK